MSNVIKFVKKPLLKKHPGSDAHPLNFPVQTAPLYAVVGDERILDPSRIAIVRLDTNEILGIHGESYNLFKNKDLYAQFTAALHKSSLNLKGAQITDMVLRAGRVSIRSHILPQYNLSIGQERVFMEIRLVSSYDGSESLKLIVTGIRASDGTRIVPPFGTENVLGKNLNTLPYEHTQVLLTKTRDFFTDCTRLWEFLHQIPLNEELLANTLKAFPTQNTLRATAIRNYLKDEAQTVLGLHFAVGYWATHHDTQPASLPNLPLIQLYRESIAEAALMKSIQPWVPCDVDSTPQSSA